MIVEEIVTQINVQMHKGITMHHEMHQLYQFLGLYGYSKCQEYHYYEEIKNQNALQHYYIDNYFKLLPIQEIQTQTLIPSNWYKYTSQVVDINTKRNTIKELMTKWIEWEKETKKLYEDMYFKLIEIKEVSTALYITKLILDVTEELNQAQRMLLELEAIGFNLDVIIDWQKSIEKDYKKLCR